MLEKFKSRKFLMALLTVIAGILSMFGVAEGTIEMVSSVGLILVPAILYITTEGKIDAASIKVITSTVDQIVDTIENKDDETDISLDTEE